MTCTICGSKITEAGDVFDIHHKGRRIYVEIADLEDGGHTKKPVTLCEECALQLVRTATIFGDVQHPEEEKLTAEDHKYIKAEQSLKWDEMHGGGL